MDNEDLAAYVLYGIKNSNQPVQPITYDTLFDQALNFYRKTVRPAFENDFFVQLPPLSEPLLHALNKARVQSPGFDEANSSPYDFEVKDGFIMRYFIFGRLYQVAALTDMTLPPAQRDYFTTELDNAADMNDVETVAQKLKNRDFGPTRMQAVVAQEDTLLNSLINKSQPREFNDTELRAFKKPFGNRTDYVLYDIPGPSRLEELSAWAGAHKDSEDAIVKAARDKASDDEGSLKQLFAADEDMSFALRFFVYTRLLKVASILDREATYGTSSLRNNLISAVDNNALFEAVNRIAQRDRVDATNPDDRMLAMHAISQEMANEALGVGRADDAETEAEGGGGAGAGDSSINFVEQVRGKVRNMTLSPENVEYLTNESDEPSIAELVQRGNELMQTDRAARSEILTFAQDKAKMYLSPASSADEKALTYLFWNRLYAVAERLDRKKVVIGWLPWMASASWTSKLNAVSNADNLGTKIAVVAKADQSTSVTTTIKWPQMADVIADEDDEEEE